LKGAPIGYAPRSGSQRTVAVSGVDGEKPVPLPHHEGIPTLEKVTGAA
jgi:hypothetical protein